MRRFRLFLIAGFTLVAVMGCAGNATKRPCNNLFFNVCDWQPL